MVKIHRFYGQNICSVITIWPGRFGISLSLLELVKLTDLVQFRRVWTPMTIDEWRVSMLDSKSTHSIQLYQACARLACEAATNAKFAYL